MWRYVFGVSTSAGQALIQLSGKLDVCIDAAAVLLAMVRSLLNRVRLSSCVLFSSMYGCLRMI